MSNKNSHTQLGRMQNGSATLENSLAVFMQSNILVPCYLVIQPLGMHSRKIKQMSPQRFVRECPQQHPSQSLQAGNSPDVHHPSTEEWFNTVRNLQALEYYSDVHGDKSLLHTRARVSLRGPVQRDRIRHKGPHTHWCPLHDILEKVKV